MSTSVTLTAYDSPIKECTVVFNERTFYLSKHAFYGIAPFRSAAQEWCPWDHNECPLEQSLAASDVQTFQLYPSEHEYSVSDHEYLQNPQQPRVQVAPSVDLDEDGGYSNVPSASYDLSMLTGSFSEAELDLALHMAALSSQCTLRRPPQAGGAFKLVARTFEIPLLQFRGVVAALSYMQADSVMNACLSSLFQEPNVWKATQDCDALVELLLGPFILDALYLVVCCECVSDAMHCALLRAAVQRATPGRHLTAFVGRTDLVSALFTRDTPEELVVDVLSLMPAVGMKGEAAPLKLATRKNFLGAVFMLLGFPADVARLRASGLQRAVAPLEALHRPDGNHDLLPELCAEITARVQMCLCELEAQLLHLGMLGRVHHVDERGSTALMSAAQSGCLAAAALWLTAGVNVNAVDVDGSTALMTAASHGHYHIAALLLGAGACVDQESHEHSNYQTALMQAADSAVAMALLAFGAEADRMTRWTALMTAASFGRKDVVSTLLRFGADIHRVNLVGEDALICATLYSGSVVVPLLIHAGSDVKQADWRGHTALMYAASSVDAGTVQALLDAGADVYSRSHRGKTVVMFASENRRYNSEVARVLRRVIERGVCR